MKQVIVIAAVAQNGVYGENGTIPWHSKMDMSHFKKETTGNTVVMGRKTWDSLPEKFKPLPNRQNIVVTRSQELFLPGVQVVASSKEAVDVATNEKVFFIGGKSLWYDAMGFAKKALITVVRKNYTITEGVTLLAEELLLPRNTWHNFRFKTALHTRDVVNEEVIGISFCEWER